MKIKVPQMPPADDATGITLNKVREARDQQWLELVGPVVEALRVIGLNYAIKAEHWTPAYAALRAITEEQQ